MIQNNQISKLSTNHERQEKITRYDHLNKTALKGQILFSGSSLMEQFPINELLYQLEEKYIIYNRGISGDTINDLIADMDTCIFDLSPSKIFINIGSNDIASDHYDEDELMNKYKFVLSKIKRLLPDTKVFILSYYPVNPLVENTWITESKEILFKRRNNPTIIKANRRLIHLANEFDYTYIDVSSVLMDDDGNLEKKYTVEGIHMYPNAYVEVLKILKEYF